MKYEDSLWNSFVRWFRSSNKFGNVCLQILGPTKSNSLGCDVVMSRSENLNHQQELAEKFTINLLDHGADFAGVIVQLISQWLKENFGKTGRKKKMLLMNLMRNNDTHIGRLMKFWSVWAKLKDFHRFFVARIEQENRKFRIVRCTFLILRRIKPNKEDLIKILLKFHKCVILSYSFPKQSIWILQMLLLCECECTQSWNWNRMWVETFKTVACIF